MQVARTSVLTILYGRTNNRYTGKSEFQVGKHW